MTDRETRESSPSPSPLQQAKQELLERIEERLRQSGEDLRHLLDAFAEAVPELQPPPPDPAPSAAPAADEGAALSGVRDSLAAIDAADSQSEVLSRLLEQATRYASRVALFLAGGDSDGSALLGWSATGFEQTGPSVEGLVLPLPEGSPWPAVLDGRGALRLSAAECAPLCSRIETALPRGGVLVPLVLRDKVEAVLYGDQQDDDPFSLEALQVLTHGAAQTLEVVPLRQRPGSPTLRLGDAQQPAPAAPEPVTPEPAAPEPPPAAPPAAAAPPAPAAAAPPAHEPPHEPSEAVAPAETPASDEPLTSGPPTLSTAPLEAVPDLETLSAEPVVPSLDEPGPAAEAPEPPAPEPQPTEDASAGSELTRGERAAGFVLEPLDEEPGELPSEPAFDLEAVDDLELVDEGLEEPTPAAPGPPTPAAPPQGAPTPPAATPPAPTPSATPAAPEPQTVPMKPADREATAEDLFFEPSEAAPAPSATPSAVPPPPEPPPPPSPPASPPRESAPPETPPDVARDTQLIGALSQPPAQPQPTPPVDDAGAAASSTGGEVVPPADIEGPGWAFSGKPTSPQAGTEPLHDEARRLARLLVSEIKLYNEELIAEGKRKGNIYQELREDIDRSRQMYEERIDEQVRSSSDYFREELIRSLAGGDASVMGL